jgi:hypothetical protein
MADSDFNTDPRFSGHRSVSFGTEPSISGSYSGVGYIYDYDGFKGPSWQHFRSYSNLFKTASILSGLSYKSVVSEPQIAKTGEDNQVASIPMAYGPRPPGSQPSYPNPWTGETILNTEFTADMTVARITNPSYAPRVTRVQLFYSLRQVRLDADEIAMLTAIVNDTTGAVYDINQPITPGWLPAGDNVRKLQLVITPVITVYNPYNVPIQSRGISLTLKGILMDMRIGWFKNILAVSKDLTPVHAVEILNNTTVGQAAQFSKPVGRKLDSSNAIYALLRATANDYGSSDGISTLRLFYGGSNDDGNFTMSPGEIVQLTVEDSPGLSGSTALEDYPEHTGRPIKLVPYNGLTNNGVATDVLCYDHTDDTVGKGVYRYFIRNDSQLVRWFYNTSIVSQTFDYHQSLIKWDASWNANLEPYYSESAHSTFANNTLLDPVVQGRLRVDEEGAVMPLPSPKLFDLNDFVNQPFGLFEFGLKTYEEPDDPTPHSVANPLARAISGTLHYSKSTNGSIKPAGISPGYKLFRDFLDDVDDAQNRVDADGKWGDTNESWGQDNVVLAEIPLAPLTNIAQGQHASFAVDGILPANPLGNSFEPPYVNKGELSGQWHNNTFERHDMSYMLNRALWDEYYFTGLSDRNYSVFEQQKSLKEVVSEFYTLNQQLPNTYLHPWGKPDIETLANSNTATADGYKKVGAHLLLYGSFNINSTSVEAWKALLLRNRGNNILERDTKGELYLKSLGKDEVAFPRFSNFVKSASTFGGDSSRWSGDGITSVSEVEKLAEEIVEQVKSRGPFASISQFVNRDYQTSKFSAKGALQEAIDETNINKIRGFSETVGNGNFNSLHCGRVDAIHKQKGSGAPGFITQADVLQQIGSQISARSDTFTVYGYGEVEIDGKVEHATCKVLVQRVPEYVDGTQSPEVEYASLNRVNKKFGRKFVTISFEWL